MQYPEITIVMLLSFNQHQSMDKTSTLLKLLENIPQTVEEPTDDISEKLPMINQELNPPEHLVRYVLDYDLAMDAIESRQTGWIWFNRN
jgi:hypothetical protein